MFQENLAEKQAEMLNRKIVRFTNIDKESFTHSYCGISITVSAGKSQIMRFPEADHLALHLARKMISREKKKKMKDTNKLVLYTDAEIGELKKSIISEMGEETPEENLAPAVKRQRDIENLTNKFAKKTPAKIPEVTKKDVIKELSDRGVKVDISKSREDLMSELMALEARKD